jgi:hypothetical protein
MEMECIFDIGKKIFLFWPRLLRWAMWPMGLLWYSKHTKSYHRIYYKSNKEMLPFSLSWQSKDTIAWLTWCFSEYGSDSHSSQAIFVPTIQWKYRVTSWYSVHKMGGGGSAVIVSKVISNDVFKNTESVHNGQELKKSEQSSMLIAITMTRFIDWSIVFFAVLAVFPPYHCHND